MRFALFIGWVVLVFAVADLVGCALRRLARGAAPPTDGRQATGSALLAGCARCTLLGFSALWVGLSVAYAFGVATQSVIAGTIGIAGAGAALIERRHLVAWGRSRLPFWALLTAVAVLASCVRLTFNGADDPEYFFLISKLLHTGAVKEYFSWRRPLTLGGWTFLQAIFSAGPAGTAWVASIDPVVGGLLFLCSALLLEADAWTGVAAAVLAVLVVLPFQKNLGTAFGMAGLSAVLVGLSASAAEPAADLTATTFAIMALTVRPQLGLVAFAAATIVCLRRRARWYLPAGVAVALLGLWIAIFVRDTGLLPLSVSPGYNPQVYALDALPIAGQRSLAWQLAYLARNDWVLVGLSALALVSHGWHSLVARSTAAQARENRVFAVFAAAAVVTVVVMVAVIGTRGWDYRRYYDPIAAGVLCAFVVRSGVRLVRGRRPGRAVWWTRAAPLGALAIGLAFGTSGRLFAVPARSSARICPQLLTAGEQWSVDQLPAEAGDTLVALDCPVGSFDLSPSVMMGDLFFATRGDDFDMAWTPDHVATWMHREGVGRLVYLDHDTSVNTGLDEMRRWVASHPTVDPRWSLRNYSLKGLEKFRELGSSCPTVRLPIVNRQGPLVIVDVGHCADRAWPRPAAAPPAAGAPDS